MLHAFTLAAAIVLYLGIFCSVGFVGAVSRYLRKNEGIHRRRLSDCDSSYLNQETGFTDADYLLEQYRPEAINRAQKLLDQTVSLIKSANSSKLHSQLATVDPQYSRCTWLTVAFNERQGLGHSFSAWSYYLDLAIRYNLTLYSPFYTMAHNLCYVNETAPYFGFHSVYYWSRSPPANATIVEVGKRNENWPYDECNEEYLKYAIANFTKTVGHDPSCEKGHVVFRCYNQHVHFFARVLNKFNWDQIIPIRAAFTPSYTIHSPTYIPKSIAEDKKAGNIVIVVHIRRGDIVFRGVKIDRNRLVSVFSYKTMLKQLFEARNNTIAHAKKNAEMANHSKHDIQFLKDAKRPISLYFLCEGASDEDNVLEYLQQDMHTQYPINVHNLLGEWCNPSTDCKVKVLYNESNHLGFLGAFTAMCESDVLITSPSGYPFIASLFCEPKITVAIPLGMDYTGLRNVVRAHPYDPLWKDDSFVELMDFQSHWDAMIGNFSSSSKT